MGRKTLDNMLLSNLNQVQNGSIAPDMYASAEQALDIEWHSGAEPLERQAGAAYQYQAELADPHAEEVYQHSQAIPFELALENNETPNYESIRDSLAELEINQKFDDYQASYQEPYDEELPAADVVRTARGTIEFVKHDIGTYIKPTYNGCGILVQVDLNGTTLCRKAADSLWSIYDTEGVEIVSSQIRSVYFDKDGNLTTETTDGGKVTIHTDGTVCSE
jgi:hypothetical protein